MMKPAFALLACVLLLTPVAFAQDNPDRWIPPNSNAVAVVKVGDLLGSKLGQRRKWAAEYKDAYAAGLISAPPSVIEIIRATEYRPYSGGSQEVFSIYSTRVDVSMAEIAKHEMTKAEKVGENFVVRSQKGAYFTKLGNKLMGALQPADRQLLARWMRFGTAATTEKTSEYITKALENEARPQVVVVVDLTDMIDAGYAGKWLAASPAVNQQKPNLEKLSESFATLRGFRLSITVAEDIVAQLRLDFDKPIAASEELMKAIVLEWLDESGARVAALANADAKITGNTFTLSSQMEEQGLRRVLSLIQTPHPTEAVADPNTSEVPAANAIASKRYYTAVVSLVKDLMSQNRKAADYQKTALWHEQFAVKIENLSTVGVDADLAAWGYDVAQRLRALASSLRGVPVEVDKLERAIRYDIKTYNRRAATTEYGAFFRPEWISADSNLQDVRAAQADTIAKDQEDREQIWNMMEEDRLKIVAKMKDKYKVDFEK